MHTGLFWKQLFFIVAGLPAAAWCMMVGIRYFINTSGKYLLPWYDNTKTLYQIILIVIELNIFGTFDEVRSYLVEESGKVLCEPLRRKYFFIGIYATIIWFISMNYLVALLWGTVHSYGLDIIIQLSLMSVCVGILMGIAVPYCSGRFWVLVGRRLLSLLKKN